MNDRPTFTREQSDALWLCYSLLLRLAGQAEEQQQDTDTESEGDE